MSCLVWSYIENTRQECVLIGEHRRGWKKTGHNHGLILLIINRDDTWENGDWDSTELILFYFWTQLFLFSLLFYPDNSSKFELLLIWSPLCNWFSGGPTYRCELFYDVLILLTTTISNLRYSVFLISSAISGIRSHLKVVSD